MEKKVGKESWKRKLEKKIGFFGPESGANLMNSTWERFMEGEFK